MLLYKNTQYLNNCNFYFNYFLIKEMIITTLDSKSHNETEKEFYKDIRIKALLHNGYPVAFSGVDSKVCFYQHDKKEELSDFETVAELFKKKINEEADRIIKESKEEIKIQKAIKKKLEAFKYLD